MCYLRRFARLAFAGFRAIGDQHDRILVSFMAGKVFGRFFDGRCQRSLAERLQDVDFGRHRRTRLAELGD